MTAQGSAVHGSAVQGLNTHEEPVAVKTGIKRFEDIEAWQLARELTRKVYRLTKKPGFEAAVRGFINYLKQYQTRVEKLTVNR